MNFEKFYEKFGGSARTKNVEHLRGDLRHNIWKAVNSLKGNAAPKNRRPYLVPRTTGLPKEYVRLDPWEMEYLFMLSSRARQGIVETGRFNGGSTFLMSCANSTVPIYSIDIAPQNDALLRENFKRHGIGSNVRLIVGDSQKAEYSEIGGIDFLWIDADHSYDGCTNDLKNWCPKLALGGHVLLHDCYRGSPVQEAVIDFLEKNQYETILSPYIPERYWHLPAGSLAHLIKKA